MCYTVLNDCDSLKNHQIIFYEERKGWCVDYGNRNTGNIGNSDNRSRWFPDKKVCIFRAEYGAQEATYFLLRQFFPDWHCVFGSWERCCNNGSVVYDWVKYLPWQEKTQVAGAVFDNTIPGHYQRAFGSGSACAAILVYTVGTGNTDISVYALWGIVCIAYFILCERTELAQLVSREYAAQEPTEIRKILALGGGDFDAAFF